MINWSDLIIDNYRNTYELEKWVVISGPIPAHAHIILKSNASPPAQRLGENINQSNRSSTHTVVEHGSRGINLARLVVDANTMSDNFTALHDSIIMLTGMIIRAHGGSHRLAICF
jgi:hypothetical protein